jgi:AcrR family transcriptional regulator
MAAAKKRVPAKAKRAQARPRNRLSRGDWVESALEALAEGGLGAVSVEALAQRLKVTKGSFYWHFRDSEELLTALVQRWEELAVDRVMGELMQLTNPCDVIRRVIQQTVAIDSPERRLRYRVEAAAAALAEWHPVVRPAYIRITQRRLNGLIVLFLATGLSPSDAAKLGRVAYMTLLGVYPVLLTRGALTEDEKQQLVAELCERLLPPTCKS